MSHCCNHNNNEHNCVETLKAEHQKILNAFSELEKAISETPIDENKIREFLDFTENFAEPHHRKEEKVLFPALEKKGIPNEGGPIGMMLLEHTAKRKHIKKIKEGLEKNDADKIKEDSKMVIALMKEHIYKEDNILYPLAEDVLAPGDLEELGKECEKV